MTGPLLSRPPEESARRLALSYLDQAAAGRARMADPEDDEALHDFRVGLRRLRSCLAAYRDELADSVPKKLARRLRRLARATGPGRDTEVQIAWLRRAGKDLAASRRAGLSWLLSRLDQRMAAAQAEMADELAREFAESAAELRRRLAVYRTEIHLDAAGQGPTFGARTAEILAGQVGELAHHLARVQHADDEKEAHAARIAAKRLRYLIEPLAGEAAEATRLVQRFKALQDLLGELHDAHVLESELAAALAAAAAERSERLLAASLAQPADEKLLRAARRRSVEPGLLALAKANRERRDQLFAELQGGWLGSQAAAFLEEVAGLGEKLADPQYAPPSV